MQLFRWLTVAAAFMALMGWHHWVGAQDSHAVARVFDGDTILLDDGRRVRLIGVDAPEVDSPYRTGEPGGDGSRRYLESLIAGRRVVVKTGPEPRDAYGRTLAFVYLGDVLVNGRIIRDGWARAYQRFDYECKDLFTAYESEAKAKAIGIWGQRLR